MSDSAISNWPELRAQLRKQKREKQEEYKLLEKKAIIESHQIKTNISINPNEKEQDENMKSVIRKLCDCDGRKNFTVISYYTVNTAYEDEIRNLIESLKRFRLNYYIEGILTRGGWDENTKYKASFIRRTLDLIEGPVVFIDADARVQEYPVLFENLDTDLAVYYRKGAQGPELLSGTMYWANNDRSRALLDKWIEENKRDLDYWEQWVLRDILKTYKEITVKELPSTYCQIFDIMKNTGIPVIEHFQGSRRFRRDLVTSSALRLALLIPTKKRPQNIKRIMESLIKTTTHLDRLRIYFLLEPKDMSSEKAIYKLQEKIDIVTIERENPDEILNLSKLWNQLYREASQWAEHFGFYGDDVEFQTEGWDMLVANEFKKRGDLPWLIRTNDCFQKDTAVLFWTNKLLHDLIGYYLPEQYLNICMDTHLSTITQAAGCFTNLEKCITYHHCAIGGRAPKDETHQNMKFNCIKDTKLYHSKESAQQRTKEIEKLRKYIQHNL